MRRDQSRRDAEAGKMNKKNTQEKMGKLMDSSPDQKKR